MGQHPASSRPATTPLDERLSYRCSMISARVARFLSPMWESRYGLSVDTWRILAVINRYGPVSAKEVAARISNDAFHVSRAIDRLVRLDLISRNVDADGGFQSKSGGAGRRRACPAASGVWAGAGVSRRSAPSACRRPRAARRSAPAGRSACRRCPPCGCRSSRR